MQNHHTLEGNVPSERDFQYNGEKKLLRVDKISPKMDFNRSKSTELKLADFGCKSVYFDFRNCKTDLSHYNLQY